MPSEPQGTPDALLAIFQRLYDRYGPQGWWPAESPFEVVVGAILTQAAAWGNVAKAIANLKATGAFSPQGLYRMPEEELSRLLRPVGYFNAKARKLRAFLEALHQGYGGDLSRLLGLPLPELRGRLLAIHGIGPETADAIILYAAGQPSFVVDAYTRRLFRRLGYPTKSEISWGPRLGLGPPGAGLGPDRKESYAAWRSLFMANLPPQVPLFNEYHALIDRHAKETCRRVPLCGGCCLREICPFPTSRL